MDSYSVFSDMNFSMETEILEVDLRNFTATDFYNKKILISAIFLSRNGGRKISEWLKENPQLVLKQDQKNSKDRWGKMSSFFQTTAFFNLESESSDGYDGRRIITPAYELSHSTLFASTLLSESFALLANRFSSLLISFLFIIIPPILYLMPYNLHFLQV